MPHEGGIPHGSPTVGPADTALRIGELADMSGRTDQAIMVETPRLNGVETANSVRAIAHIQSYGDVETQATAQPPVGQQTTSPVSGDHPHYACEHAF
jgi:hypothetical protein